LVALRKWLVGCGAATSGVYRAFDQNALIAIAYYFGERVRFARCAKTKHDTLAFLHEANKGEVKFYTGLRRGKQ
jgi:cbb3-type cytochrome oxidase subunit 1